MDGRRIAEATARWIDKHPAEFQALFSIVKDMQANGVIGRVRDRVATEAMNRNIEVREGDYRFANGLWAGIARYMVFADPSLKNNPIEFQRSVIDNYGLVPINAEVRYGSFTYALEKD